MNISQALRWASALLESSGIPDPSREAASLVMFALDVDRAFLFAHSEQELLASSEARLVSMVKRRSDHEPYQYIIGKQEFFELEFEVSPAVLIPRPETETLVVAALDFLNGERKRHFLELGVGSGCISVSVLKNLTGATAVGVDISDAALDMARRNAVRHNVDGRVEFKLGDLFLPVNGRRFNAVLSNPPYVSKTDLDGLQPEVRDFEPHLALTDGSDGLSIIKQIVRSAPSYLTSRGYLALEFGLGQAADVAQQFHPLTWSPVRTLKDRRDIDRVIVAQLL